ncbi:hypothetical protein TNCV_4627291 [Trichonephila clavipes]|nr:hypothetical protein TNCV_4627291 [Trichonephila clavipes]
MEKWQKKYCESNTYQDTDLRLKRQGCFLLRDYDQPYSENFINVKTDVSQPPPHPTNCWETNNPDATSDERMEHKSVPLRIWHRERREDRQEPEFIFFYSLNGFVVAIRPAAQNQMTRV